VSVTYGEFASDLLTELSSGELNAKHRELLELQALAQRRLKGTRANFADGMRAAKEVKRDLDWTQKRVS
jgi:biogenesis of lysosome-related organelles complex 1 subunit KXD1